MLTQKMQNLSSHSKKVRADAENSKRRNIELPGECRARDARATVESAMLEAVEE